MNGSIEISKLSARTRHVINGLVNVGSVILCLLVLPTRLPGMEMLGIGPNWLLIWVVTFSMKRSPLQGAVAGLALGLLQDGLTGSQPTHSLSLMLVGILTARIQKQRYIQEDFISVALIVFGMAVLAASVTAFQYILLNEFATANSFATPSPTEIWLDNQRIALSSAILSSLWAPVVYYPLNHWWQKLNLSKKKS